MSTTEPEAPDYDVKIEADELLADLVEMSREVAKERDEYVGYERDYEYQYHPRCGQRLPAGSLWLHVDADSPEEAVLKYDLRPCKGCFNQSYRLNKWRKAVHGNWAHSSKADVPDDVLRKAGLGGDGT